MKMLPTIIQFIAKVKGKKGGRWEAIWREKGERIEGQMRGVRLGRKERDKRAGGRQGRDTSEKIGKLSHFPNHSGRRLCFDSWC
jgi:hypothetical protein